MATNLQLIEDALREINVIAETDSASAEQGTHGLRRLNQMMAVLQDAGSVDIGWFEQSGTGDTFPLPIWAELAVTMNLAIAIAPKYGATVSLELATVADKTLTTLKRKLISESRYMDNTDMSHLPEGSGHNYGHRYDITTDR